MSKTAAIRSVNWHLISACNYSCKFCFARNLGEKPVPYSEGLNILKRLHETGMEKINFAGGEPLLHPHIFDYCHEAHDLGMVVSVTTNGSKLTEKNVHENRRHIDWIGLSVDSACEDTEILLGRGRGGHVGHCTEISDAVREAGIRLKINTTVTALSWMEEMGDFIRRVDPDRWKVFQMLHIKGENDDAVPWLSITDSQFDYFNNNHKKVILKNSTGPVFESADMMESSYFMLTPGGQVKTDTGRIITKFPLEAVLHRGVSNYVFEDQYFGRGGVYAW